MYQRKIYNHKRTCSKMKQVIQLIRNFLVNSDTCIIKFDFILKAYFTNKDSITKPFVKIWKNLPFPNLTLPGTLDHYYNFFDPCHFFSLFLHHYHGCFCFRFCRRKGLVCMHFIYLKTISLSAEKRCEKCLYSIALNSLH